MSVRKIVAKHRVNDGLSYHSWFDAGLSVEDRFIVLDSNQVDDEIDVEMSLHFIKCMALLESINQEPITVIVNSMGGEIHSSFAIYDRIIESQCPVCVRCYGAVMSGASIIMQAGDTRQMSPHSYMMIHDGSVMLDSDMAKAKKWVQVYDDMSLRMYDIYFDHAKAINKKITKDEIAKMCKDETILTSQQALKIGLIDEIYTGE